MRILAFNVDNQTLTKQGDFGGLVAGSKGYLVAQFAFSSNWAGRRVAAVFTCGGREHPVTLQNNRCKVPQEASDSLSFKVHLVGTCRDTTMQTNRVTIVQRRY